MTTTTVAGDPPAQPSRNGRRDQRGEPSHRRRWRERPPTRDDSEFLRSLAERIVMLAILAILAFADAYQFWLILSEIFAQQPELTGLFVSALAVGAITVAHIVGRLVRSRRAGYGGSLMWITALVMLWLALGSLLAWIRLHHERFTTTPQGEGDIAITTGAGLEAAVSPQLAGLLLIVYLIAGAVAMTHAYRFGDPRSAEIRRALRERRRLADEAAQLAYAQRLAEAELQVRRDDRERDHQQHEREQGMHDSRYSFLRSAGHQRAAQHLGDPQATDALTREDGAPFDPGPRPDADPAGAGQAADTDPDPDGDRAEPTEDGGRDDDPDPRAGHHH